MKIKALAMFAATLTVFSFAETSNPQPSAAATFKGIAFGSTLRTVSRTYEPMLTKDGPFVTAAPSGLVGVSARSDTLAGVKADITFFFILSPARAPKNEISDYAVSLSAQQREQLSSATLHSVHATFSQEAFSQVVAAVSARYGQPDSKSVEPFNTRGGLTYESETLTWQRGEITLRLEERYGHADKSYFRQGLQTPLPDSVPSQDSVKDL